MFKYKNIFLGWIQFCHDVCILFFHCWMCFVLLIFYLGLLHRMMSLWIHCVSGKEPSLTQSVSHNASVSLRVPLCTPYTLPWLEGSSCSGSGGGEVLWDPRGSRWGWQLENRDLELRKGSQSWDIASRPLPEEGGLTEIFPSGLLGVEEALQRKWLKRAGVRG